MVLGCSTLYWETDVSDVLEACFTRPSSDPLFVPRTEGIERPPLGSGMLENWTNCIERVFWAASRRMKALRTGIEAAMTDMAGSAVPKIFKSTVVAVGHTVKFRPDKGARNADSQLLSEMSFREMIFMKAMMPELEDGSW